MAGRPLPTGRAGNTMLRQTLVHTELLVGARMHGFDSENILLDFSVAPYSLKKSCRSAVLVRATGLS